jgi:hypothetical protein
MNPSVQLGKKPARLDERTFRFKDFLAWVPKPQVVAPPPPSANWLAANKSWPMYGNDTIGDCVEAAAGHGIQIWNSYVSPSAPAPTEAQIIAAYSGCTGYVPGQPSTDQGTDMLSFMNYWRKTGVAGNKILAFMALTPGDLTELEQATWMFGFTMVGLAMPTIAQGEDAWIIPNPKKPYYPPGKGWGSWGGHCVPVGMYDLVPDFGLITWGEELLMAPNFYQRYNDESYAVLSQAWIEASGQAPSNFNLSALEAALAAL